MLYYLLQAEFWNSIFFHILIYNFSDRMVYMTIHISTEAIYWLSHCALYIYIHFKKYNLIFTNWNKICISGRHTTPYFQRGALLWCQLFDRENTCKFIYKHYYLIWILVIFYNYVRWILIQGCHCPPKFGRTSSQISLGGHLGGHFGRTFGRKFWEDIFIHGNDVMALNEK